MNNMIIGEIGAAAGIGREYNLLSSLKPTKVNSILRSVMMVSEIERPRKTKFKLEFLCFEANIQMAVIPDLGVWYRVRLGSFSDSKAGKTISALKQNGIIASQLRVQ
jgi:hypothetical protein